jgi:hypothetical protein
LNFIAYLAIELIVSFDTLAGMDNLFVQRVPVLARDFDHNSFGHLIAGHDTGHTTTIVHASPST